MIVASAKRLATCFIFAALLSFLLVGQGVAQYKLDVKTTVSEKRELQVAKAGAIKVLESRPWAGVEEVGEDYSLWLSNMERSHEGDSIHVVLDVYLRTPAMLTRGNPVDSRRVQLSYHWEKARSYARDSINAQSLISAGQYEKLASSFGQMAGMVASAYGGMVGVEQLGAQLSGPLLGNIVGELSSVLSADPTAVEIMESSLLGERVAKVTEQMIESNR